MCSMYRSSSCMKYIICLLFLSQIAASTNNGHVEAKRELPAEKSSASAAKHHNNHNPRGDGGDHDRPKRHEGESSEGKDNKNKNKIPREMLSYPDFMIIGAQKAATTTFHSLLVDASQGQICGEGDKEKFFFSSQEYERDYVNAVKKYIGQFSECKPGQLTNDATPSYTVNKDTPRRIKESYTPEEFAKKKFIFLLREPVHRHYSEFQMACRVCLTTEILKKKGMVEYKVGRTRVDRWIMQCGIVAADPNWTKGHDFEKEAADGVIQAPKLMTFREWIRSDKGLHELHRGVYADVIDEWLKYVRRDQLFILSFQYLIKNTSDVLKRVEKFLELPKPFDPKLSSLPAPPLSRNQRRNKDSIVWLLVSWLVISLRNEGDMFYLI